MGHDSIQRSSNTYIKSPRIPRYTSKKLIEYTKIKPRKNALSRPQIENLTTIPKTTKAIYSQVTIAHGHSGLKIMLSDTTIERRYQGVLAEQQLRFQDYRTNGKRSYAGVVTAASQRAFPNEGDIIRLGSNSNNTRYLREIFSMVSDQLDSYRG